MDRSLISFHFVCTELVLLEVGAFGIRCLAQRSSLRRQAIRYVYCKVGILKKHYVFKKSRGSDDRNEESKLDSKKASQETPFPSHNMQRDMVRKMKIAFLYIPQHMLFPSMPRYQLADLQALSP